MISMFDWGAPLAMAVLAVGARCSIDKGVTLGGVMVSLTIGLFVGSQINLYLLDYAPPLSLGQRTAAVSIGTFLSRELLTGLMKMGENLQLIREVFERLKK